MANVKRTESGGATRILTKSVGGVIKVSCACCDALTEVCCPYEANKLGVLYDREDLPEQVELVVSGGENFVNLSLVSSGVAYYTGGDSRIRLGVQAWIAEERDGLLWAGYQDYAPSDCLIGDPSGQQGQVWPLPATEDTYVADKFADTYVATCTGSNNVVTSKTYNREGMCVWRSRNNDGEVDGELYYRTHATEEEAARIGKGRILWGLSGTGFRSANDGPYNSPAGIYGAQRQCSVEAAE